MSRFFQALRRTGGARAGGPGVQEADVQRWGLTGQRGARGKGRQGASGLWVLSEMAGGGGGARRCLALPSS